jgi:hypothetical protein
MTRFVLPSARTSSGEMEAEDAVLFPLHQIYEKLERGGHAAAPNHD